MTHFRSMAQFALFSLLILISATGCKPEPKAPEMTKDGVTPVQVFTVARFSPHKSLDPVKQFDGASGELIQNLYDTLLTYHYLKRPYEMVPNLVTKMPVLGADGLTYEFELRDDIYFIDDACFPDGKGRKLNADDVLYSLKRFADANLNTASYHVLLKGAIVGMDEFREATKKAGKTADYKTLNIPGFKKVDARHFTITLTKKNPLALMPFAVSPLSIVPREAVEKYAEDFSKHPVGSGPFKMHKFERRGVMVLKKNPRYHRVYPVDGETSDKASGFLANAGQKLPLIDEVRMPLIEESQPRVLKFKKGELDWIPLDRANFVKMAERTADGFKLKGEYAKKYRSYHAMANANGYYSLNMKDPLVGQNKALRQAMAYALDRQAYIDQMRNGRGVPLNSVVPLGIAGNEKDIGAKWYETNIEKAKAKLKEAGFPEGKGLKPIKLEFASSSTDTRNQFEFLRAQFAKANIPIEGSFQGFTAFLDKLDSGNFQMAAAAWGADYPDPENFYQLFYGPNKAPGSNNSSYANPEYDRLYEGMRYMENGPERNAIIKQMADILKEDVPALLSSNPIVFGLYQPWIGNFKRNMMHDLPIRFLTVDPSKKTAR